MANFKKTMIVFLSFFLVFSVTLPMNPIQSEAAGEVTKVKISDIDTKNSKYKPAVWSVEKGLMQLGHGNKFQAGTLVMEWQMLQMMAKLDRNYHLDYNNKDVLYEYYKDLNVPLYGAENASKRNANISRGHFARLYAAMNGLDLSEVQANTVGVKVTTRMRWDFCQPGCIA